MTLVEVLAGLALLGTLLVAILLAKGRATLQQVRAERRLAAAAAADRLLTLWWKDLDRFPRHGQGYVDGRDGFTWRTRVLTYRSIKPVTVQVVRVDLFERDDDDAAREQQQQHAALVSVEVLLPADKAVP